MKIQALPHIAFSGTGGASCVLATSRQTLQISVRITGSYLPSTITGKIPALSTYLDTPSTDLPQYTVTLSNFEGSVIGKITVQPSDSIITYIPISAGALVPTIVVR